jgi:glycosyltransferase involved in cell wall biosynthesis
MTTFSIVTVCHNAAAALVGTAKSIFDQTFSDYQFIVQDRASTDQTADIVKTYGDWIDSFHSDPDANTAGAMNRALGCCTGQFTLFLEAGVRLVSNDVLAKLPAQLLEDDDIVSGHAIAVETRKPHLYRDPALFWSGPISDMQATFVRTDLAREMPFDESLKFASALDFVSRARLRGAQFRVIDLAIYRKSFGSAMASREIDGFSERHRTLMRYFGETHAVDATLRGELAELMTEKFGVMHRRDALKQMSVPQLLAEYEKLNVLLEKPGSKS